MAPSRSPKPPRLSSTLPRPVDRLRHALRPRAIPLAFRGEVSITKSQMSPLRRHTIEDMVMRNVAPSTQQVYTYAVAKSKLSAMQSSSSAQPPLSAS